MKTAVLPSTEKIRFVGGPLHNQVLETRILPDVRVWCENGLDTTRYRYLRFYTSTAVYAQ